MHVVIVGQGFTYSLQCIESMWRRLLCIHSLLGTNTWWRYACVLAIAELNWWWFRLCMYADSEWTLGLWFQLCMCTISEWTLGRWFQLCMCTDKWTLGWWFSYACVLAVSDPAGPLISPPLSKLYMCTHDIEVTTEHLHWAQLVFEAWHLRQNSGSLWTMLSCTQTNLTQLDSCWIVFCAWHTHLLGCGVKGWINPYSDSQVCNMVYINILQCIMAAQICTCFPNCFGVI